jgi:bis(5'-nucleosidyl)-tetraphosphatase
MIYETSAGFVLFREENGRREYLLLHYPGGHFDFPKGHIEEGESEKEAAGRELTEETGITKFNILDGYRHVINYVYRRGPDLSSKDVIFFLAETPEKEITISDEHQGYLWLSYMDAYKKLSFDSAKTLILKAETLLSNR